MVILVFGVSVTNAAEQTFCTDQLSCPDLSPQILRLADNMLRTVYKSNLMGNGRPGQMDFTGNVKGPMAKLN